MRGDQTGNMGVGDVAFAVELYIGELSSLLDDRDRLHCVDASIRLVTPSTTEEGRRSVTISAIIQVMYGRPGES